MEPESLLSTTFTALAAVALSAGGELADVIPPASSGGLVTFKIRKCPSDFERQVALGQVQVNARDLLANTRIVNGLVSAERSRGRR